MPRHPVVNRRNISPLVRKFISVTEEGYAQAAQLASELEVSTGSVVDTALRQLAGMDADQVLELLRIHGHLTEAEYAYVAGRRAATGSRRQGARRRAAGAQPAGKGQAAQGKADRARRTP
ncbi:MAG: hypothetical protein ACRDKW_17705 [Actinomycetota bacterium]